MAVRLSKVAREFNVGLSTIVEFLHNKGIKISSDPNAKLTDEDYALVAKEFSADSEVKKASLLVDLKNSRKKKETISVNHPNTPSIKEDEKEQEEFISIKDEIKLENKIKIVDHINLNTGAKTSPSTEISPKKEKENPVTPKEEEVPATETQVSTKQEQEKNTTENIEKKEQVAQKPKEVKEEKNISQKPAQKEVLQNPSAEKKEEKYLI